MDDAERTALAPLGTLTCRDLVFPKDPNVLQGRARKLVKNGLYERKEADAALKMVRPGDTVLELGAGIGFMSTLLSVHCKIKKVVSFEANPTLIPYIQRVHKLNGVRNAIVENVLLAPQAGPPVPFYLRENFLASSMDKGSDPASIIGTEMVEVAPVSEAFEAVRPNVFICDIEGAEAELFPAIDFSHLRIAIVELHPQWIGQKGVQAVFDAFHRSGLTYWPKASEGKVVCFRKGW